MTQYLNDSFAVQYGGKKYRDNWDRVFGASEEEPDGEPEAVQPLEVAVDASAGSGQG